MLLVLRISEALALDEEQTIRLATQLRSVEEKRTRLLDERAKLEASLEEELTRKSPDAAKLETLTGQAIDVERQLLLLPEETFNALRPMLNAEQRAKLVLLRSQLKQQVQAERERRGLAGRRPAGAERPGPGRPGEGQRRWMKRSGEP